MRHNFGIDAISLITSLCDQSSFNANISTLTHIMNSVIDFNGLNKIDCLSAIPQSLLLTTKFTTV